ncbi:MAG: hypothetical protein AB1414_12080 [bacterium]
MIKTVIFILLGLLIGTLLFVGRRLFDDTHVTKAIILKPYNEVWAWLSEPNNYAKLYPKWVSKIERLERDKYLITSPHMSKTYKIRRVLNEEGGSIDIEINLPNTSEPEISRTRIMDIGKNRTAVIHLGSKWSGFNAFLWLLYTFNVDSDFHNAKKVIESS